MFLLRQFGACVYVGLIVGLYVAVNDARATWTHWLGRTVGFGILYAFAAVMAGFGLTVVVDGLWEWRLGRRFQGLVAYENAVRAHEREEARRAREFWVSLDGRSFELELVRLYQATGYAVRLTGGAGDQGVDIELTRDGKTTVVQCKAHAKPVGPAKARELYGAMLHRRADAAILASVAGFTPGVLTFVVGKPIQLLDLDGILAIQNRAPPTPSRQREPSEA
jgi:hypothetical protein